MPKKAQNLTRDVLAYIFSTYDWNTSDNNVYEDFKTPMTKFPSNTDLQKNIETPEKPETNWEVDPDISPPTSTSSPLPKQSESNQEQTLVNYLIEAKTSIENALKYLPGKNDTFTKKTVKKRVSNIPKTPVTPNSRTQSSYTEGKTTVKRLVISPLKIKQHSASPKKFVSPRMLPVKITPKIEKKPLVPMRLSSLRSTPVKSELVQKDTPRPDVPKGPNNIKMTFGFVKPLQKGTTFVQQSSKLSHNPKSPISKPKSGIPAAKPPMSYRKITK